jgi:hypothetical protein
MSHKNLINSNEYILLMIYGILKAIALINTNVNGFQCRDYLGRS